MSAILGPAAVALGLLGSVAGAITVAFGLARGRAQLLRMARSYAWLLLAAGLVAAVAMEIALLTDDFSIKFVHDNSAIATPLPFKIATLWSALEGSIILWALILTAYIAAVGHRFRDRITDPLVAWAMLTLFVVAGFFFFLLAGPANPFHVVQVPPGYDGPGPNPLLQNHILMAVHPPMLYLGYVGFTVPFAFAIGALVTGRLGEGWLLETRRWTLLAWGFLSLGIILGGWWSYEVLGWGGYWAWDPVENASLLPWLTGTAYLHSVMVQERRGLLRVWNLSLLCATFSLTILGTFLTRSGVVASVHAFSDSSIGPLLLGFFGVIVVVSVGLITWRGEQLRAPGRIDAPVSREGAFLANNVVFAAFAVVVLLGTTFPLIVEATGGGRLSVGEPYFDRMTMPLGMALLFLMAVAPVLPWRRASTELLRHRLFWPAVVGVVSAGIAVLVGARGVVPVVAFALAGFAGGSAGRHLALAIRRQGWRGLVGRSNGGMVVHIGVVLVALGFAASSAYARQADLTLAPGESATFAGYELTFLGGSTRTEGNRSIVEAQVSVNGSDPFAPSLRTFSASMQPIGTPSVATGPVADVYLVLTEVPGADGVATIRVIIQPLVVWIWVGGIVIALGTVLSAFGGGRTRAGRRAAPETDRPAEVPA